MCLSISCDNKNLHMAGDVVVTACLVTGIVMAVAGAALAEVALLFAGLALGAVGLVGLGVSLAIKMGVQKEEEQSDFLRKEETSIKQDEQTDIPEQNEVTVQKEENDLPDDSLIPVDISENGTQESDENGDTVVETPPSTPKKLEVEDNRKKLNEFMNSVTPNVIAMQLTDAVKRLGTPTRFENQI